MLQNNVAVDKRELLIRKSQAWFRACHNVLAVRELIESLGFLNHHRRDIHTNTSTEASRQRLSQSSHAATKVQGRPFEVGATIDPRQVT